MNENFMGFPFSFRKFSTDAFKFTVKKPLTFWKPHVLHSVQQVFMENASLLSALGGHQFFLFHTGNGALSDASETVVT